MSRAESRTIPPAPRVGSALRGALSDFYYNSWRFLAANLVVGALLVVVALAMVGSPWAILLTLLLIPPVAGTMRMATTLIRDGHADFDGFVELIRRPWKALALGAIQLALAGMLLVDGAIGAAWDSLPGTFLLVSAVYGLLLLWTYALVAWPLLLDPERDADPVRARLRLALVIVVAHPLRVGSFALLIGIVVVGAGLAIAPLLTFVLALAWLAIARWVLPVADRIEGRRTHVLDDTTG